MPTTRPRPFLSALVFAATLLGLGLFVGCSNYQVTRVPRPDFQSIYVAPITSEATIPQGESLTTRALRTALNRDPRVSLGNSLRDADVTVTVVLTNFGREIAAVQTGDTGLARKYDLILRADVSLTDNRTGQLYFENRSVTVRRQSFTDSGQLQAEYGTLPVLAEALGKSIVRELLDVW